MATAQSIAMRNAAPNDDAIIAQALDLLTGKLRKPGAIINHFTAAKHYLRLQLAESDREIFSVLFLDNRHCVIAFEKMFYGTFDGASVHPREVARRALYHNAAAVILAHNHPSGDPTPSDADIYLTHRISDALDLIDVRTLDHIVVGREECSAFSERGLMDPKKLVALELPAKESENSAEIVAMAAKITRCSERIKTISQIEAPTSRQKAALTMARRGLARALRDIRKNAQ